MNDRSPSDSVPINLTNMQTSTTQHATLPLTTTIAQLKQQYFATELNNSKLVRIIYLGKVLNDTTTLYQAAVQPNHTLHVVVTDKPVELATPAAEPAYNAQPHYQQYRVINFNRDLYPAQYHNFHTQQPPAVVENLEIVDQRVPYEGHPSDFVLGFFLGFILGPLSVFWLFTMAISRRQRAGILAGLLTNILISLVRIWFVAEDTAEQHSSNNDNKHNQAIHNVFMR